MKQKKIQQGLIITLVTVTMLLMSQHSWSWAKFSHRVICDIAWRNLTMQAKQEVRTLVNRSGHKTFANACVWPDKIRRIKRFEFTRAHHYINVSESATTIDLERDCGKQGCVVEAVEEYINVLRGIPSQHYLNSPQQALLFLGHLLGDLHQPLHVAFARDRGGNDTYLNVGGAKVSLHYLWDVSVPEYNRSRNWRKVGKTLANGIDRVDKAKWRAGDVRDWAHESLLMVRAIYRELPQDGTIGSEYFNKHRPWAEKRLQQAGWRLATVINDICR